MSEIGTVYETQWQIEMTDKKIMQMKFIYL